MLMISPLNSNISKCETSFSIALPFEAKEMKWGIWVLFRFNASHLVAKKEPMFSAIICGAIFHLPGKQLNPSSFLYLMSCQTAGQDATTSEPHHEKPDSNCCTALWVRIFKKKGTVRCRLGQIIFCMINSMPLVKAFSLKKIGLRLIVRCISASVGWLVLEYWAPLNFHECRVSAWLLI